MIIHEVENSDGLAGIFFRFESGRYDGCLLIQDGYSDMFAWYWRGNTEWVKPPQDIQLIIDMWIKTKFANMELKEFLLQLLGETL